MSAEATRQGIISMLMGIDDEDQLAEIAEFLGRNPFHRFRSGGSKICYVDAAGVRYERVLDLRQLSDSDMEIAMDMVDTALDLVMDTDKYMVTGPDGFMIKSVGELTEVDAP